ncbi:MAG: TRAP transporter TatT component family protein [Lysobacteraceae bacterium]
MMSNARHISLTLVLLLAVTTTLLSGCAGLVSKATDRMATNLGNAVLNQDDPATVRDGLPAYLLLLDGLLEGSPDSPTLLAASSRMYSSYAGSFVHDNVRAKRLSRKALDRAWKSLCIETGPVCALKKLGFEAFGNAAASLTDTEINDAYLLGSAWATYIQAHRDDWVAIADIPKVDALLQRVAELRPALDNGMPWVYLGVLNSLRPAAVGGEPEKGRAAFEKAVDLSDGRNLMAKTLFAEFYARLVFEQALHDRLLNEVIETDPESPGLTLSNVLAQDRAKELLAGSQDYF